MPPTGTRLFRIGAHLSRLQVSLRVFSSCCRKLTSDLRVHCSDWLSDSSRSICQHTVSLSGCGSGLTFDPGRLTSCSRWLRCLLSATRVALRDAVCCSSFFNPPSEEERRSASCLACRGRQTERVLALDYHQGESEGVFSIYSLSVSRRRRSGWKSAPPSGHLWPSPPPPLTAACPAAASPAPPAGRGTQLL